MVEFPKTGIGAMDQELKAYLDQKFQESAQQTQQLREEMTQQVGQLREEMTQQTGQLREETGQQFRVMNQRLETIETDVRGAYVAIEGLHGQIRLVAEGVSNVVEQLEHLDEKVSRELAEIKIFNRLSYQDLDVRVRKLEAAG
jgi:archaellum component FlaC